MFVPKMLKLGCSFCIFTTFKPLNFIIHNHALPPFLLFSTSLTQDNPSSSSLAHFLVSSLGFSKQQSLSTSTKLAQYWHSQGGSKKVSDFSFAANAGSVINFFKQHGFDDAHIRKVVTFEPRILTANVDKTLEPKFKHLQDLGLCGSDLVRVISVNPVCLRRNIEPATRALRDVLGSDEDVLVIIKRCNWLTFSAEINTYLPCNVELLENEYGIPREKIKQGIMQRPRPYMQKTELFRNLLVRVEEKLGIPPNSGVFLYGIHILDSFSEKTIESKCRIFESFGWTKSDITTLIRHSPTCLTSSEARLRSSLDLLMNELGCERGYLVSHPSLLTYSVEKKILPRHRILQILKEKGLLRREYALYTFVCLTESQFLKQFVLPFKEVHGVYAELTGSHPRKLIEGSTERNS